jgi:ribonuclease D
MPTASRRPELEEQLVARPEDLPACCEHLAARGRFGLDTEFVGEDTYHPHLCLVQVATAERLILIDPLTVPRLDLFWKVVTDPNNEVVVHAGREEVRLCRLSTGLPPGRLFDLQIAAGLVGMSYPLGHGMLVSQLLGVQLSKAEKLTEWRKRPLSRAQVRYALDDVRYLLPLWERLHRRLQERDRLAWAEEEFARLKGNAQSEEIALERWRRLRGLGSLDRRRLAVARELYSWREETAARMNRPARAICRDDLIVEIARHSGARERDLHTVRGLPRRHVAEILEVVSRAIGLPEVDWPDPTEREQDPPRLALLSNVLMAVLANQCTREQLAPNLVASGSDVRALVRAKLGGQELPGDSLLTQGWRAQSILPMLVAMLEGRLSLRVADVASDTPLAFAEADGKADTSPLTPDLSPQRGEGGRADPPSALWEQGRGER